MKKFILFISLIVTGMLAEAQSNLSIEKLWSLGRIGYQGISVDKQTVYYSVSVPDIGENKSKTTFYSIALNGGEAKKIDKVPGLPNIVMETEAENVKVSPDGKKVIFSRDVKIQKVSGKDFYPSLTKSNVMIYDNLNQRHWDTWEDGAYSHVFVADNVAGFALREKDIMTGQMYDCPQKPHGGEDDLIFSPDSKQIIYVSKKKTGKHYALSTNTDLYLYDMHSGATTNLTEGMMGFDTEPRFSNNGNMLAWLSMEHDGFESDKNELWMMNWATREKQKLSGAWNDNVNQFIWSEDDNKIYFTAPHRGTQQLFEINVHTLEIKQFTQGMFDITGVYAQNGNTLVVSRTDMNHAAELYTLDLSNGNLKALTHANDQHYAGINMCPVKERYTELDNGEQLFSWVIYPPDFDPNKKYPVLLYCQGGPQSALSQFYSFRWNFQLMASQGYIVVAPNRTGMPGWGVEWNANISKDWGGNPMRDYLAAIDDISRESYIDINRRGAVGASYGGYSVFMLAGIHEGRFKTFIAHDGLFDLKSWYGTTEELWFANWDIGGPYWDKQNQEAQYSYKNFNPMNFVEYWDTPIMIIQGGMDFRVPIEQGMQAFQAAQLKGIKSKLLYFPEENHWILKAQNAMVWQNEFYKWLRETL